MDNNQIQGSSQADAELREAIDRLGRQYGIIEDPYPAYDQHRADQFVRDGVELVQAEVRRAEDRIMDEVAVALLNNALQEMIEKRKQLLAELEADSGEGA